MKIRLAHRLRNDPAAEITERSRDAEDYATGLAELRAEVPADHVVLWIDVDR